MAPERAGHRLPAGRRPLLSPAGLLAAAALASLPAAPAFAARKVLVLEDAAALERAMTSLSDDLRRHDEDCRSMEALLPEYREAARGEPSAARARRDALWARYGALIDDANRLCDRQMDVIDAVNIGGLTRGISRSPEGRAFASAIASLLPSEAEHSRLCHLNDKLIKDFEDERKSGDAAIERAAAEAAAAPRRRAVRTAAALAAAGLAAAVLAWALRRRPALLPAPAGPAPGEGDYSVGRMLGTGALGDTFEGFDKTLRRKVALKRLRPELLADPSDARRLAEGARAAAALTHAGLVSLHALARQDGRAYLVFEFVDGPSLAALLARGGALSLDQALRALASVAEGLEAAHAAGMAHGDVRPADILLATDGPAKLKGLGFASSARSTLERVSRMELPPRLDYMAPEREIGAPDAASDTYALAACFYHMATGRPPFSGPDALADKRAGRFAPPRSLAPALPPAMDALFAAALSPDPAARFPSPRALAAAAAALR